VHWAEKKHLAVYAELRASKGQMACKKLHPDISLIQGPHRCVGCLFSTANWALVTEKVATRRSAKMQMLGQQVFNGARCFPAEADG